MIAETAAPEMRRASRVTWSDPIIPAPTTPTRSSLVMLTGSSPPCARWLSEACQVGAAENVLPGAAGYRERPVNVAAGHVLLDDGEGLRVDRGHGLDDRREVRYPVRGLDHDVRG